MTCDVPGCQAEAIPCLGAWLCMPHGTAVSRALAARGMDFASWEERCAEVERWVERKRAQEARHASQR